MSEEGWWEILNQLARDNSDLLNALNVVAGVIIGLGVFQVARRANAIAESNLGLAREQAEDRNARLSAEEREVLRENYHLIRRVLAKITSTGDCDSECLKEISKAYEQARLELPSEIVDFVGSITEAVSELHDIHIANLDTGSRGTPEAKARSHRKAELVRSLNERDASRIFRKYLEMTKNPGSDAE